VEGEVIVGFLIIGVLVCVLIAEIRTRKYIQNMYNSLINSPNNEGVDRLIAYIKKKGCVNQPNYWNRLRNVWYSCNKSSNVSTNKKEELLNLLLLNGIRLNNEDKQIIDNYKG